MYSRNLVSRISSRVSKDNHSARRKHQDAITNKWLAQSLTFTTYERSDYYTKDISDEPRTRREQS